MFKIRFNKKGVALLIVLGMLLIVTSLVAVILSIILSHPRLTHHEASRIQAYYAALAGINYAIEKLRLGDDSNWQAPATGASYTRYLCNSGCTGPGDINDVDLPNPIVQVVITVTGISGSPPIQINAKAIYTYTPS